MPVLEQFPNKQPPETHVLFSFNEPDGQAVVRWCQAVLERDDCPLEDLTTEETCVWDEAIQLSTAKPEGERTLTRTSSCRFVLAGLVNEEDFDAAMHGEPLSASRA